MQFFTIPRDEKGGSRAKLRRFPLVTNAEIAPGFWQQLVLSLTEAKNIRLIAEFPNSLWSLDKLRHLTEDFGIMLCRIWQQMVSVQPYYLAPTRKF